MLPEFERFVERIHASPMRIVLAVTGGGSGAISRLLEVPGASRTVLAANVPYAATAMTEWLGGSPDQACSSPTARAMAMAAYRRACGYHDDPLHVAGLAATASLATDRPKRGAHRVHLALQTAAHTASQSLVLAKGRRTRAAEEDLVTRLILNLTAEACGLSERLPLELVGEERIEHAAVVAPPPWRELLLGRIDCVCHGRPTEPHLVRVVFPGAFHPLHAGHRRMAQIAAEMLGAPVEFELSIANVDKPPLDYLAIEERTAQFAAEETVWLTRAPTFAEKSRLFAGATFVVGADTLHRIADVRYYGNDPAARDAALEAIAARGCRFLVYGRQIAGRFATLAELDLPDPLRRLAQGIPAAQFREDISSTELRRLMSSEDEVW